MSKRKKRYAKCPSCNTEKHRTEMETVISVMKKLDRDQYKHYKELKIDTYSSFIQSNFDWACDDCLNSKKAIQAIPELQNYCWNPHYAYFDSTFICNKCKSEFIFKKEEKKFWYESLKFWIDSTPNNCTSCRKDIRQLKIENKTLSEILRKEESEIEVGELEKVIAIYTKWEKIERAKYYKSILVKRKRNLR